MENDTQSFDDGLSITHGNDNVQKADNKKGMSVTRALVLLGFDEWKNLEPGMMVCFITLLSLISYFTFEYKFTIFFVHKLS